MGLITYFLGQFRWFRPGRLPGDIVIQREGFSFYFPIVTMILLSALLTLVVWIATWIRR